MLKTSFEISDAAKARIEKLKNESVNAKQYVCVERARYLTEAYIKNQSDPMILRRAKALRNVLEKITLFIEDGQLLAGNHAASLRAASIFPEYTIDWINDEIDQLDKRAILLGTQRMADCRSGNAEGFHYIVQRNRLV